MRGSELVNKRSVEDILTDYRQTIGPVTRQFELASTRKSWKRPAYEFAFASVLIVSMAFSLWPRNAAARLFRAMSLAIKNARSMEVVAEKYRPEGRYWREYSHTFYRDGMWRFQTFEHSPIEATYIVRDSNEICDITACDHATLQPLTDAGTGATLQAKDALEFAQQLMNVGEIDVDRSVSMRDHSPVDGHATYVLALDRPKSASSGLVYHGEILVDKVTNLPIESYVGTGGLNSPDANEERWKFKFNESLDPNLFEPSHAKRIVDLKHAERDLTSAWEAPVFEVNGLTVHDASVGSDGTIWIAYSKTSQSKCFPTSLDCKNGVRYVYAIDMEPSMLWMKNTRYTFHGQAVRVVGFIPVRPGDAIPKNVNISFGDSVDGRYNDRNFAPMPEVAHLALRLEPKPTPDYFVALDLDHFAPQIPKNIWSTRATIDEKAGDLLSEARDLEELAEAFSHFIPRLGEKDLQHAIDIYLKVGKSSDVVRATKSLKRLDKALNRH